LIVTLSCLFGCGVVAAVLHSVEPPPAPASIRPGAPLAPRLSARLLLVIVDGLRYDVATDPVRMPHFAAAMQNHTSGEIWAGRVSMTTSAVLTLGTGQRGRLEQVIRNVSAHAPPHNSWLENAKAQGLRLGVVGDHAWDQLFGAHFDEKRLDPDGVAIDVDFNAQSFANTRELLSGQLDAIVAHFVTPDHQGHAYGIRSLRYTEHIHGFDQELATLLSALPKNFTVVVTSDHGAADSGTHGTDVPVQRRSPIFAYGPGIRDGVHLPDPLDQLDLSATLPVLLGVSPPAHGTGNVISAWLDVSPEVGAEIACKNAARVVEYSAAVTADTAAARAALAGCGTAEMPEKRDHSALLAVRAADDAVTRATGLTSPTTLPWLGALGVAVLALCLALGARLNAQSVFAGATVLAVTVWLIVVVERLPSIWPNVARGSLLVVGNALLLTLLLWPARFMSTVERHLSVAPALLPGVLVAGYPADICPEAFVTLVLGSLLLVGFGALNHDTPNFLRGYWRAAKPWRLLAVSACLLLLAPIATTQNGTYSGYLRQEWWRHGIGSALLVVWLWGFRKRLAVHGTALAPWALALVAPLWLRPLLGPLTGRACWFAYGAAFVIWLIRRNYPRAIAAGMAATLWVARDFEIWPLLATITLAWLLGDAIADRPVSDLPRANRLLYAALAFCLVYLLRVGIQDGLEFGGMDWGAGAFKDPRVSPILIGAALTFKYALGAALIGIALCQRLEARLALDLGKALLACTCLRVFALTCTFFIAGSSYWTALRVFGDLPGVLTLALGALIVLTTRVAALKSAAASQSPVETSPT